jgi:hypothetical protein
MHCVVSSYKVTHTNPSVFQIIATNNTNIAAALPTEVV